MIGDSTHEKHPSKQVKDLLAKADHWANFGTLTSLVSTAAYFIESTFVKRLPKWLSITTLGAVGVGIMGVLASYYYKFKAGKISIAEEGAGSDRPQEKKETCAACAHEAAAEAKSGGKQWTNAERNSTPAEMGR